MLATLSPHVAANLAPAATRLGLRPVGAVPLMVLREDTPAPSGRAVEVVRALGPALVAAAGDLAARGFGDAPRDVIARVFDAAITATAGVECYVALADGRPVSTVSVTPAGTTAGIWSMATPPEDRRQGWGRALLARVIGDYRRRGVRRFFLTASSAGRPLYAGMGFEQVAEVFEWLLPSGDPAEDSAERC